MAVCKYTRMDREGQIWVAVLVSTGYGAGWSTWNDKIELAIDRRIIEWLLANAKVDTQGEPDEWTIYYPNLDWNIEEVDADALKEYCESIGYKNIYIGGAYGLEIRWYKEGTAIYIDEYDGYESVTTHDDLITL